MPIITELSDRQRAQLRQYASRWIEIGYCTQRVDRELAEAALRRLYVACGVPPPKLLIFSPSPFHALRLINETPVWLGLPIQELISICLQNQDDQARELVADSVRKVIEWELSKVVSRVIGRFVCAPISEALPWTWDTRYHGQHDAGRVCGFNYLHDVCRVPHGDILTAFADVTASCGWWWPFDDCVVYTDRPVSLCFHRGRLHADGEPAASYSDGWSIYVWHGTPIPEKWGRVRSEDWKPEWLLKESIIELRRVLIQGLGCDRIMAALGSRQLHREGDMELHRIERDIDVEPVVLLSVRCPSTAKRYVLRVPPHVETCEQARLWTLWQTSDDKVELINET